MAFSDLPPFGIRDLNGPTCPPGLIQITPSQYDSTVHSQPDAALSYIDLDDGELITVGSSFELQQRLEEPIPPSTSPVPFPLPLDVAPMGAAREDKENKLVHIFDIRHTSGSLAVWRDHEAYTMKKLRDQQSSSRSGTSVSSPHKASSSGSEPKLLLDTRKHSFSQDTLDESSTVTLQSAQVSDSVTSNEGNADHSSAAQPATRSSEEPLTQTEKTPASALTRIESHLGPLADFLESTAEGLRKLAEKTAEADTSPVENVLSGFKNILKEAGELGLDLLSTIVDQELEKNRSNEVDKTNLPCPIFEPTQDSCPSSSTKEPRGEVKEEPDVQPAKARVSFVEKTPTKPPLGRLNFAVSEPLNRDGSSSEGPTPSLPPYIPPKDTQRPSESPYLMSKVLFPPLPARYTTGGPAQSVFNSIIDSQPPDSDVLTRYPALHSLRKAASVSGLQNKPRISSGYQHGLSTTSALSRYPSIGQFEQQSRANPPVDLDLKHSSSRWGSPIRPLVPPVPKKTDVYKKPTVDDEDEPLPFPQIESAAKAKAPYTQDVFHWSHRPLPGASPEPKSEQQPEPKREDRTSKDFTVPADTSKVYKDIPLWLAGGSRGSFADGLSQRTGSPDGMTYSRGSVFPKKSQTVSGTNPAARLNGPFDPLAHIPVLQPRPQRSQPDLSAPKVGFLNTRLNSTLPGSLPQRSQTLHHTDRYKPRDTAPYHNPRSSSWENYMKNNRSTTTNLGAYYDTLRNRMSFDESKHGTQHPATFNLPVPHATRPPSVSTQRPKRPLNRAPPTANQNKHSPSAGSPPSVPELLRASRPEVIRVGPTLVSATSVPLPPSVPAPPPAAVLLPPEPAARNITRSSSILSPCPPAFTRPRGRSGISPPAPFSSSSVDECVKALKAMGFGRDDPNELARLNIYAGAAAGDVEIAIQLIEEDREAAKEFGKVEHTEISKDLEKEADVEENPWEL
ncbi:uncharacterized protein Z520_01571 [Fonsecaea multimorphosa CBS 102226]|uniref:UBA domain-containing protein n=1 Tax=Fonsecaea multimorphosa CBS 102226 TaxID=1442371 RepID=A0A0D2L205_9EURO|nr:uncharacterized protein Z520_01571 [Fonsecaea multimorphosa CBS 102226]KIY03104.1 hypothetical protein Z520_01571 [Fonsecaea multimorphosa CBS 102226]OAL30351.1 hypothetical protein AYO22_01549 [Fonsecaea multimorphosa]